MAGPTSNITTSSSVTYVQAAYDRMAYFSLRPELIFDQLADVKSVNQSMPGSSVTFTIQNDLAPVTKSLTESVDITPQTLSNSQIVVSLSEYGNAVTTSAALRGESYVEIDPIVANVIGYNAGVSIDSIARNALAAGGTQLKAPGSLVGSTVAATVTSVAAASGGAIATYNDILATQKNLRAQSVAPFGSYYAAVIHPDVAYDLQLTNNYLAPHQYAQPAEIWAGEVGALNGFRFIETPRAKVYGSAAEDNTIPLTLGAAISAGTGITTVSLLGGTAANPVPLSVGTKITLVDNTTTANTVQVTVATATVVNGGATPTVVTVTSFTAPTNGFTTAGTSVTVNSAAAGVDSPVYTTFLMGRQALAKVHSIVDGNGPVPKVIPGPITDTLRRFVPLGWYWLGGYSNFRQPALMQYFTQSSLTNIDPTIDG